MLGFAIVGASSGPPDSMTSTCAPEADNSAARTEPAAPAPTTMKSYRCFGLGPLVMMNPFVAGVRRGTGDDRVQRDVRQNRGVIDLSVVLRAGVNLRAPRDGLLHAIIDKLHGITRDDGTDDGLRVEGIACRQALRPSDELTEEFFVDLALNDDAPRVEANLPLMKEGAKRRRPDRVLDVHVVEDDHRVETAKFQDRALQGAPGAFREHAGGLHAPDQVDDAHFRTIEELVRNDAGGSWRMSDNIDDPRRESGFLGDLGEHDACGDRGELGWLDH